MDTPRSTAQQSAEPHPPAPRPAAAVAAIVLLLAAFMVGIAVGQSGLLDAAAALPRATPASTPAASATTAPASPQSPAPAALEDFELFWQALDVIRQSYVGRDELDETELTYGAIRGLVDALGDTGHSVFLTPEEARSEQNALEGDVVGIGVLLGVRDDRVVVVSVVSGGPAQEAGVRAGDEIIAVDGQSTVGLTTEEIAAHVRGDEGTPVDVTVLRPSTDETLEFSLVRERIRVPAASWVKVPGTDIALLRLVQFSAGAADQLREARDAALAAGAEAFILDLRGNPGGYIDQAVNAASLFLDQRTVYIREQADGTRIRVPTNTEVDPTNLPLVTLIDENSASSAEILSGALKSAERGALVGETTFGTGTVLLPFELPDGSTIRLAVERWLTPEGELIFDRGIVPTVEVALGDDEVPVEPDQLRDVPAEQVTEVADSQLERAIELLSGAPPPSVRPSASASP